MNLIKFKCNKVVRSQEIFIKIRWKLSLFSVLLNHNNHNNKYSTQRNVISFIVCKSIFFCRFSISCLEKSLTNLVVEVFFFWWFTLLFGNESIRRNFCTRNKLSQTNNIDLNLLAQTEWKKNKRKHLRLCRYMHVLFAFQ